MLRKFRIVIWIIVALAGAGLAFLLLRPASSGPPQSQQIEMVDFGGPFTLTGSDGKPFSSTRLEGKPYAIFFGFTHCPDVCPTTLARMVRLREQLGASGERLQILFVTVDPERDGPAEVGKYAELFDSTVTGLTGSPAQIEQVKKKYGIFSRKVPSEGGDYSVDHTATVLLFDSRGEFTGTIAQEEGDQAAIAKLQRIVA
jgi:protein SCO1/2